MSQENITPYMFVSDPSFIGQGAGRTLDTDFSTLAAAQAALPEVADELAEIGNLSVTTWDWAALQSMSNYAQKFITLGAPLQFIPAGEYLISETWKITKGDEFRSATVYGSGKGQGTQIVGTAIIATFGDRPAISVQGGRAVKLADFQVTGINVEANYDGTNLRDLETSNWSSGPGVVSEGRYNPYVGIAVDPYTTDPGGGQGYPNDPYGRKTTSQVRINNIRIAQFYVAFGAGLSASVALGDSLILDGVDCGGNTYACVSGGSQNRILAFINGYIQGCHTAFNNLDFGTRNGNCFQVSDTVAVLFTNLVDYRQADPCVTSRVHAEQFLRIGTFSGGPQQFPAHFNNCQFKFFGDLEGNVYRPATHFQLKGGRAVFNGCRFDTVPSASRSFPGHFQFITRDAANITFEGKCTFFQDANLVTKPVIGFNRLNSNPAQHVDSYAVSPLPSEATNQAKYSLAMVQHLTTLSGEGISEEPRLVASNVTDFIHIRNRGMFRYENGNYLGAQLVPGFAQVSLEATTFNYQGNDYPIDQLVFSTSEPEYFQINDQISARIVQDSPAEAAIGVVTEIDGSNITVQMSVDKNEIIQPATSVAVIQNIEWAPLEPLVGEASTASTTVTFSFDVSAIVWPGDFIQGEVGNWNRYRVVSVAPNGLSLELNKNAPTTGCVNLFWGRLFALSGTAI